MKKDQLIDGISSLDDELIAEAGNAHGFGYRTKIRLMRTIMIGAAAAAMIATGLALNSKGKPVYNEETESETIEIDERNDASGSNDSLSENAGTSENSAVITAAEKETNAVTITTTTTVTTKKQLAYTTTSANDTATIPADNEIIMTEPIEPDTRPEKLQPGEVTANTEPLPECEIYSPVENYSNTAHPDVVSVQYGAQIIMMKYNLWLNATQQQADEWLNCIDKIEPSEPTAEIDFSGGGYIVRVNYNDGTYELYELMGGADMIYFTARDGSHSQIVDISGNYMDFFNSVYNTYLANAGDIDAYVDQNFDY